MEDAETPYCIRSAYIMTFRLTKISRLPGQDDGLPRLHID